MAEAFKVAELAAFLARTMTRRYRGIVLGFLLLGLLALWPVMRLTVAYSFEGWIDPSGALFHSYQAFTRDFGPDDHLLAAFPLADLLRTQDQDGSAWLPDETDAPPPPLVCAHRRA